MSPAKSKVVRRNRKFQLLISTALCLAATVIVAHAVQLGLTKQFDEAFTLNLNALAAPTPAFYMQIFTDLGGQYVWMVIVAVLFFLKGPKGRRDASLLVFSILLGVAVGLIFEAFFFRLRPYLSVEGIKIFTSNPPQDSSFPSGHSVRAFAGSSYLSFRFKHWSPVLSVFAFAVGMSRIYLGVHFPSDVVAGVLIGVASSLTALALREKLSSK